MPRRNETQLISNKMKVTYIQRYFQSMLGDIFDQPAKKNPKITALRAALEQFSEKAQNGEPWALQLLLKMLPKVEVRVQDSADPEDLARQLEEVLDAGEQRAIEREAKKSSDPDGGSEPGESD